MKQVRPLLLVTNDDGISAPGVRALIAVMAEIGDVVVVAPDKPQSAMGHAITINSTLYLNKISKENAEQLLQVLQNDKKLDAVFNNAELASSNLQIVCKSFVFI